MHTPLPTRLVGPPFWEENEYAVLDPWTLDHGAGRQSTGSTTDPQSTEAIMAAQQAETSGLMRDTGKDQQPIDMTSASDWSDSPDKGGISYGSPNTGGKP